MKIPMSSDYPYGYARVGSEILSRSRENKGVPDPKETFQIWCAVLALNTLCVDGTRLCLMVFSTRNKPLLQHWAQGEPPPRDAGASLA